MALTRKLLKSMGIEEEKIDQIIEAHAETVDALKTERDSLKETASKAENLEKSLAEANKTIEQAGKDAYKVKYEAIKEEFEAYKTDISAKETKANKTKAYEQLLKDAGISEKRISSVLKVSDIDSIELDTDGKIKDASTLTDSIKNEWSDFIQKTETQGASTANPPSNPSQKSYTADDIRKMSTAEINANYEAIKTSLKN